MIPLKKLNGEVFFLTFNDFIFIKPSKIFYEFCFHLIFVSFLLLETGACYREQAGLKPNPPVSASHVLRRYNYVLYVSASVF